MEESSQMSCNISDLESLCRSFFQVWHKI